MKADRLNRINDLQSRIARELNEEYVGREEEILVDGPAPRGENSLQGRTKTDKVVIVKGPSELLGKYVRVKIVRASHWSLEGEIAKGSDVRRGWNNETIYSWCWDHLLLAAAGLLHTFKGTGQDTAGKMTVNMMR